MTDSLGGLTISVTSEEELREKVKQECLRLALAIEKNAKMNITKEGRVDTGRMRASVQVADETGNISGSPQRSEDEATGIKKGIVAVGTTVEYAKYHEKGTEQIEGIHFMERAITQALREE